MTIRTFFTILAVLSFLFGVGFVLAPDLWRCWGDYSAGRC
jgi:hypothetical protein